MRWGSRRSAGLAAVLLVVLLGGYAIGRSVAPRTPAGTPIPTLPFGHTHSGASDAGALVGGLAVSANGFTLVAATTTFTTGVSQPFAFRILGADRAPVVKYDIQYDKPLHLVVVRSDLSGYQHLHPTLAADGTWSVPLTLSAPGLWRAYADFATTTAAGRLVTATLGVNLTVTGSYQPVALPVPAEVSIVDGYSVVLDGTPQVNVFTALLLRVGHDGQPVVPQRYLGAYGHLVVVREADLGYLHIHPDNELANGAVRFWLAAPSPGRYRAYFDFQVSGRVHTAGFTLQVP